jgi:hypothetical protein
MSVSFLAGYLSGAARAYGGAVLPEADGDKRPRSNLTISCPQ